MKFLLTKSGIATVTPGSGCVVTRLLRSSHPQRSEIRARRVLASAKQRFHCLELDARWLALHAGQVFIC